MLEIIRWISLGLSMFAMCFSFYSLWLSLTQNKRLLLRNHELTVENIELRTMCNSYWDEIVELRERVSDEG